MSYTIRCPRVHHVQLETVWMTASGFRGDRLAESAGLLAGVLTRVVARFKTQENVLDLGLGI
jgi:hypothetical protein